MRVFSRTLSAILAGVMMCMMMLGTVDMKVQASDEDVCIDGSYLTEEDSSEGVIEQMTWGNYLKSGTSSISDAGNGKISAGGNTVAQKTVASIKIGVRVERLNGGMWEAYKYWSVSDTNTYYVSTSKTFSVNRGYYYRVYSIHTAGGETSGSYTSGVFIK